MEDVWQGDVWGTLEAHQEMKQHCIDPNFRAAIDAIRQDHSLMRKYMDDPRVVQVHAWQLISSTERNCQLTVGKWKMLLLMRGGRGGHLAREVQS